MRSRSLLVVTFLLIAFFIAASRAHALTGDAIAQHAYLKPSNTGAEDEFGFSIAVSGDTVVVGAPFERSSATGIDGDGSDNSAPQSGAAYVYVRTGAGWVQQAYLKASNTNAGDAFGFSVAISGDVVLIGAPQEDSNTSGVNGSEADNGAASAGAAYVFVRSGSTWTQQAYLKASNTDVGDAFGWSVSASGETLLVGAVGEASTATGVNGNESIDSAVNAGAVYVFVRNGSTWTQQAYLKASNTNANDDFGRSTSIDGDTIVIGADQEASSATGVNGNQASNSALNAGAAYVFVRNGTTWSQQAYLKASNTEAGDYFGLSVAVSGDSVVVGAPLEDSGSTGVNGDPFNNNQLYSGAAYVYERTGTTWVFAAYVKASNTNSIDEFARAVSISNDTIAIGARYEASAATTVGGNPTDNSAFGAGAVYLYSRSGMTWAYTAYLKASNAQAEDYLGASVAISADTIVAGANHEESGAHGVNGDQSDNSVPDAGAAYAFVRFSSPISYCFGDGAGSACPCGNSGVAGNGCASSLNASGANLSGAGLTSIASDTFVLTGSGMPNASALYFQGTTRINGGLGAAFGDGLRCAGGTTIRLGTKLNASGASSYPGSGDLSISVRGLDSAGNVRTYQVWYRNAAPFCTPSTFNLTNGIEATWIP